MESLTRVAGSELVWTPSRTAKRTYELSADIQTLATLYQPSIWSQARIGVAADRRWHFTRVGVLRQQIVIADADTGAEFARMARSDWTGNSILTLSDGRRYSWRSANIWRTKWTWRNEADQPLLHFRQFGAVRLHCAITVEPQAVSDPHLVFLATLGWYLMLLTYHDMVVATTASRAH